MHEPPTAKQLAFLARLKYGGPPPKTKAEASVCIDELLEQKKLKRMSPEQREAYELQRQKQGAREQKTWLRERRAEIREQIREDLEWQRDSDPRRRLAGWILRIGPDCPDARHLDGLLVTTQDGKNDPSLLPPYDSCRDATCTCEIEAVAVADVPKGTRVAERAPEPARKGGTRRKRGRRVRWVLMLAVIALLIYLIMK
jgi:hypothetical protein